MLGRVLLVFGLAGILHATFATYEHFIHLKALGKLEGPIPKHIVVETVLALVSGIFGSVINAPPLKEITWSSEMRKHQIDDMDSRLGFASYVNRGTEIFKKRTTGPK